MLRFGELAIGVCLGVLGTWAIGSLRSPSVSPARSSTTADDGVVVVPVPVSPPSSDPRCPSTDASRLAELEAENAHLLEQLLAVGVQEIPFPDELPELLQPESFGALLAELDEAEPDATLIDLDCSEYPCLAVFEGAEGTSADTEHLHSVMVGVLSAATRQQLELAPSVHVMGRDDGFHAVLSYPLRDDAEWTGERTRVRRRALLENLGDPPGD